MKVQIYSTEYLDPLSTPHYNILLGRLPLPIQQKVKNYRRWQDAYGCMFGKLLLVRSLQDAGLSIDLNALQYTRYGRPYIPGMPDFNISHSGNRVACIQYDGGRVGIDLEEIRAMAIGDLRNQFYEAEWEVIQRSEDPLGTFYHFWTAKESILKADGRGLNLPLAELRISGSQEIVLDGRRWKIRTISVFANYACHIAYEGEDVEWEVININWEQLCESFYC